MLSYCTRFQGRGYRFSALVYLALEATCHASSLYCCVKFVIKRSCTDIPRLTQERIWYSGISSVQPRPESSGADRQDLPRRVTGVPADSDVPIHEYSAIRMHGVQLIRSDGAP